MKFANILFKTLEFGAIIVLINGFGYSLLQVKSPVEFTEMCFHLSLTLCISKTLIDVVLQLFKKDEEK